MIILGFDIGTKRIGVAQSDELGMFAHPVGMIERGTDKTLIREIAKLIKTYAPPKLVFGLPIQMDGTKGIAALEVERLIAFLKKELVIDIETWDERLTTKEAMQYMQKSELSGSKKRRKVDALAAKIMLQHYLDTHKRQL